MLTSKCKVTAQTRAHAQGDPDQPQARTRATDFTRRTLLRTGSVGVAAAGVHVATNSAVRVAGLPGANRRFTGLHEMGSFDAASMPNTIWLNDRRPDVDAESWRLKVVDSVGTYEVKLDELLANQTLLRATLDCPSGWCATQDWTGVHVRDFSVVWAREKLARAVAHRLLGEILG